MRIDCSLLCDAVTVREGLLHILGGGVTRLGRETFPAPLGVGMARHPGCMTRDEADAQLRQAIVDHTEAYGYLQDDELLSEYAVVASWQNVEANGRTSYSTHFHTPNLPQHHAVGLFTIGISLTDGDDE